MCFYRRRRWHPTPVLLPGKSHGRRSLVGCSPWGCEESDTNERLHFHFSLSCIGGGNGNPLQCSCLENPRDGRAWWAAVYGVAQSWTRLKRLSSSSSSRETMLNKKQIQAIFLFKFKMGRKAAKTTRNINNASGSGSANNIQCTGGSRNFAKETRALKRRRAGADHWKLTTTS